MTPNDLRMALGRRPFTPFRIHVTDGTVYQIKHPDMIMLTLGAAIIGANPQGANPPAFEHAELVDWRRIVRVEPLAATPQED